MEHRARPPKAGDTFDILDWGSITGALTKVNLPALAGALSWDASGLYTAGVLSVGPVVPADFDRDGDVDSDDLASFQACASGPVVGYGETCAKVDLDHDGDVDQSDFGLFQRCYSGRGRPADPNCAN